MTSVTYIVFDTNVLHLGKYNDFSEFAFNRFYDDILGKIERHDVVKNFVLLIPQISINEIYKQQEDAFEKVLSELEIIKKQCDQIYEIDLKIDTNLNYSEYLLEKKNSYIKNNEINILPICNENRFSKIVDRALNKQAPFEGGDKGKSDKGFKDALIWESMLEFALSTEESSDFIFITNDKGFQSDLINEFEQITERKITFYTKNDQSKIDLQIEEYSEEKVVKNKIENAKLRIDERISEFLSLIENSMKQNIEVNGLNCNVTKIEIRPEIIDLNEYGSNLFQFKIKGKVLAEKPGVSFDLHLNIKSLAEFENGDFIKSFSVDDIEATLSLSGDSVNLKTNSIEFLLDEQYRQEDEPEFNEPEEQNNYKITEKRLFEEPSNVKSEYKMDFSIYNQIITENQANIDEESFNEFINILEEKLTLDWFKFPSKVAKIKLEIKKFCQKNGMDGERVDNLVKLFLEKMEKDYRQNKDLEPVIK